MGLVHTLAMVPNRYAFVCRIPFLPDLTADSSRFGGLGNPVIEGYARQLAFLRALSAYSGGSCSLQLRFVADQASDRPIDIVLLGAALGAEQALDLLDIVRNLMPSEVPVDPLTDVDAVEQAWFPFGQPSEPNERTFAEIRRALEPLDPTPDLARVDPYDFVLLNWGWSPHSLTNSLELMRQQRGVTILAVTVSPARVHYDTYEYLTRGVERFQALLKSEWENPLVQTARNVYFDRARRLRQAALQLRVFMASDCPLMAGAPEFFGADLSRQSDASGLHPQGFEVVQPRTPRDLRAASTMLYQLESPLWGFADEVDDNLRDLVHLVDPLEAHTAFRIPLTPRGGLAGVATARRESFGRGAQVREPMRAGDFPIMVGSSPSLGSFSLTSSDINEHVLVAGVPGSGKSTTVRSILRRLAAQGVPFLVLDPAKTDYAELVDIAAVVKLDPDQVAFNPLAVPANASVRGHQARILSALDSGLGLSHWPLARTVAALALSAAYSAVADPDAGRWPTLADLYRFTRAVIPEQGFVGEAKANIQGSFLSRLEYLVDGPLGDILSGDERSSIQWPDVASANTVVELRNITGTDERNLVFGFLFAGLVGYREANPIAGGLGHVTVLEEAHRLVAGDKAHEYASSVFSEAIAELRGSGEGFVIVDQAPSLLVPTVSKNTGTKLTHRLLDAAERRFAAEAMVLNASQSEDLARLARGRVLVHSGSLQDAVLVDVEASSELPAISRPGVAPSHAIGAAPTKGLAGTARPRRPWCIVCPSPCHNEPTQCDLEAVEGIWRAVERTPEEVGAYVARASEALLSNSDGARSSLRLYCVSARVLSDHLGPDHRDRARTLRVHRQAWAAYVAAQSPTPGTREASEG